MIVQSFDTGDVLLSVLHKHRLAIVVFEHLPVALLALTDLWSEPAHLLHLLLFFVPFAVDSTLNLVAPDLVPFEKAGGVSILMRELLSFRCHSRLKCALFKLLQLLFEFSL